MSINSELYGRIDNLYRHRYEPLLIKPKDKRPMYDRWSEGMNAYRLLKAVRTHPDAGIGILTRYNPAIDIDCLSPEIAEQTRLLVITRFEQLYQGHGLLPHLVERVGKAPKTMFLAYTAKPFRKVQSVLFRDDSGLENRLEILGDGQQCVIFGIHPDTKREYTQPEDSILKVPARFLPEIDRDWALRLVLDFEQLCQESGLTADHMVPREREQPDNVIAFPATDDQKSDIQLALLYIDADIDHDRWVSVGMALHLAYSGSAEGLHVFDEWSAQGGKHKDGEPEKRWKSFHIDAPQPVTISTIFAEAVREGFNPAAPAPPVEITLGESSDQEETEEEETSNLNLMQPPGLLGDLAEFYKSVMFVPDQAEYALAAAINTISFATQNAFTTPTSAGLNTLIFCVGRTGSGKDAALATAMQGAVACDLAEQTIGDFTSGQAVVRALTEMGAVNLIKDEMGQFIGTKRDSVHTATTITSLMTYATKARSIVGKKWAADPKRDLPVVSHPFLNVFSCTTPEVLARATTSDALADGFMNRFLYFTPKERAASSKYGEPALMPKELKARIGAIVGFARGKTATSDDYVTLPTFGEGAEELWHTYWIRNTTELDNDQKDMFGRAGWHSLVIATLVAIGRMSAAQVKKGDPVEVSSADVQYGIELTNWSVKNMCEQIVNKFGDSDFTALCDKALSSIQSVRKWAKDKKFGVVAKEGVMLRSLLVRIMRIKSYDLAAIIQHLTEAERIIIVKITLSGSQKKSVGYRVANSS